jgi:hypothetical protein
LDQPSSGDAQIETLESQIIHGHRHAFGSYYVIFVSNLAEELLSL